MRVRWCYYDGINYCIYSCRKKQLVYHCVATTYNFSPIFTCIRMPFNRRLNNILQTDKITIKWNRLKQHYTAEQTIKPTMTGLTVKPTMTGLTVKPTMTGLTAKPTMTGLTAKPTMTGLTVQTTFKRYTETLDTCFLIMRELAHSVKYGIML